MYQGGRDAAPSASVVHDPHRQYKVIRLVLAEPRPSEPGQAVTPTLVDD